jgi:hypothetical protein
LSALAVPQWCRGRLVRVDICATRSRDRALWGPVATRLDAHRVTEVFGLVGVPIRLRKWQRGLVRQKAAGVPEGQTSMDIQPAIDMRKLPDGQMKWVMEEEEMEDELVAPSA